MFQETEHNFEHKKVQITLILKQTLRSMRVWHDVITRFYAKIVMLNGLC